jgi:hypothetical protein
MVLANLGVIAINVHDAMWVETKRAVGEACNELEQVRADYLYFPLPTLSDLGFLTAFSLHVHDEFSFYSWIFFCQSVSGCSPHQLCLVEICHQPCLWFSMTYIAYPNSLLAKTLCPKLYQAMRNFMQFQMMYRRNM